MANRVSSSGDLAVSCDLVKFHSQKPMAKDTESSVATCSAPSPSDDVLGNAL